MTGQILLYIGDNLSADDIGRQLRAEGLEVTRRHFTRNMDALATTIVVTGANVLISVLNAVFLYLQARRSGKIVIQSVDGWRVEIPSTTAKEDLQGLIELASTKKVHQITVVDTIPNKPDASND
jgi:hypothetical protein